MILNHIITTDLEINTLMDLGKLKPIENASNLKVNASELARNLGVDRRTIRKYVNGYENPKEHKRDAQVNVYELFSESLGFKMAFKVHFLPRIIEMHGIMRIRKRNKR